MPLLERPASENLCGLEVSPQPRWELALHWALGSFTMTCKVTINYFRSLFSQGVSYSACEVCVFLHETGFASFCDEQTTWFILHGRFSCPGGALGRGT